MGRPCLDKHSLEQSHSRRVTHFKVLLLCDSDSGLSSDRQFTNKGPDSATVMLLELYRF